MQESQRLRVVLVFVAIYGFSSLIEAKKKDENQGLLVMTVATDNTDGFQRFIRSTETFNLDVKVLGMGQKWEGGDIVKYAGGGQKVNLLKEGLEELKEKKDLIVMFVDSYDVIMDAGADAILAAFKKFDARVVFSAEGFCWPDASLAHEYPEVKMSEKRYLNSGGFIGYATDIYKLIGGASLRSDDDDQLFYTKSFLDKTLREKLGIKLDSKGEIFQNLNGALDDVKVKFKGSSSYLYNMKTGVTPLVIHGNGPIKHHFNALTNYLGGHWTPTGGCNGCKQRTIHLDATKTENYPQVMMAIFIEQPTAFLQEFFYNIGNLSYPKSKIDLYIHYSDESSKKYVDEFLERNGDEFGSKQIETPVSELNDWTARNKALEKCNSKKCEYLFTVDGDVQLEDHNTLVDLIQYNRSVIAPLLSRPGKLWSNFWGSLSPDGFYKRSDDYAEIVTGRQKGQWNVPYISQSLLIHGYLVPSLLGGYTDSDLDSDMAICKRMREKGIFMYVDNQKKYGLLVDSEQFDPSKAHGDLYMIFDNREMWEKKYLHPEFNRYLNTVPFSELEQPCPDVFWMPIVTTKFCWDLIDEMEHYGKWSGGGHQPAVDDRLGGSYENVPTVDIHTNQIDWEPQWLEILKSYIGPYSGKVFEGYYTEARAHMNFVVRYTPGEQDRLKPHSDSSSYTINIALNRPGIDFTGGGTRFIRQNCSVTNARQGWLLMHAGRLTHFHEGLPTTGGTRYIMVSFIDP